jgi:hypothetical protein
MRHGQPLRKDDPVGFVSHLMTSDGPKGREPKRTSPPQPAPNEGEDLPYKVELWNESKTAIEQLLAVTANASIGHAAFYAAAREFAERYVTLSHKQAVINRWNAPSH